MKVFEMSNKENKNGRRHFKAILYRIHPDSCVDEANQVGTEYQKNGITWIREYCEKALPSINGMSLRCEFINEDRTEILGHGDTGIDDGEPIYEDAVVIGTFTKGYIEDVQTDDGTITACIGEGEIDAQCYHNFVKKLEEDSENGIYPSGSIEIMRTEDNNAIVYKYGYKEKGRIPMEFNHSGFALLGVAPADDNAKLIEINENKEDSTIMTEAEIKALVSQSISDFTNQEAEINKCKEECQTEIEKITAEKNEIVASKEQLQKALDEVRAEFDALNKKYDELYEEAKALEKALGEAKAKERIGEFNSAIAGFTDAEKEYAKAEIEAFKADPMTCEINTVVNKIWEGIGKTAKAEAEAKAVAEQNALKSNQAEDIFGEVVSTKVEDTNIF